MIGSLIRLAVVAIFCLVVYNYFFGTAPEKENSKQIFHGAGVLFSDVKNLVSNEKEKFDAGKYNSALNKMSDVIDKLKSQANSGGDPALQSQVNALDKKRADLQQRVDGYNQNTAQQPASKAQEAAALTGELETLLYQAQVLVNKVSPADDTPNNR